MTHDPLIEDLLRQAGRAMLAAHASAGGPLLSPLVVWYDGAQFWATTSAGEVQMSVLRRDPRCALYVPPADGRGDGVVVRVVARAFGVHDPLGTALHTATISTALGALAARNAASLFGYAQDAARIPPGWLQRSRVVLRLRVESAEAVRPPEPRPGMAPALPTVVPAPVRRAVGGEHRVVVAADLGALPHRGAGAGGGRTGAGGGRTGAGGGGPPRRGAHPVAASRRVGVGLPPRPGGRAGSAAGDARLGGARHGPARAAHPGGRAGRPRAARRRPARPRALRVVAGVRVGHRRGGAGHRRHRVARLMPRPAARPIASLTAR